MEQARITGHSFPADQIDEGLRHWYDACPCCLSQAYPDVKQALDEERAATSQAHHGQASGDAIEMIPAPGARPTERV